MPVEISSKKYVQTTWNFRPSKLHQKMGFFDQRNYIGKSASKQRECFDNRNYIEKSTWKKHGYFDQRKNVKKNKWKQRGFFDHWNYSEKSTWKRRGFDVVCPLGYTFKINYLKDKMRHGMWVYILLYILASSNCNASITFGTGGQNAMKKTVQLFPEILEFKVFVLSNN